MAVRVQCGDFDAGGEIARLAQGSPGIGAVASFVGVVRGGEGDGAVAAMTLEHYPGMTQKVLENIVVRAKKRWDIADAVVIHRAGTLKPGEQIVLAAVASAHRQEAFAACQFIVDCLKTEAPFWKKEQTANGTRWVEAREGDEEAARRWGD